jgi:hypothetical protein
MRQTARLLLALVILVVATSAVSQSVRSLRGQVTDLPQTETDRKVLNLFFGSVSAVQGPCSESLVASLQKEKALAACASYSTSFTSAELARQMVELEFMTLVNNSANSVGAWLTPWRENADFGTVRELEFEGTSYFLAIRHETGTAYLIKFLD